MATKAPTSYSKHVVYDIFYPMDPVDPGDVKHWDMDPSCPAMFGCHRTWCPILSEVMLKNSNESRVD